MNDFIIWFSMGFEHIADWGALDHILFLTVLCGIYQLSDIKKILLLITAFTFGHSLTLALSTFDILNINNAFIEFLIPITIVITAITNIFQVKKEDNAFSKMKYIITLSFGLIHGLGFSYVLKSLLSKGESIVFPLFSFNIGLEIGQIVVVSVLLLFLLALYSIFKIKPKIWTITISILVLIPSILISINRLMDLINL